jgi:hypothetical protein
MTTHSYAWVWSQEPVDHIVVAFSHTFIHIDPTPVPTPPPSPVPPLPSPESDDDDAFLESLFCHENIDDILYPDSF